MTTTDETGVSIWFENTGLTLPLSRVDGRVMRRGQTLVVTPELRALATDRLGNCVYDLTPEQQEKRFGKVMFRVGQPPSDFNPLEGFALDDARAAALRAAALLPTAEEQRIASARIRAEYGSSSESSSKTLAHYK